MRSKKMISTSRLQFNLSKTLSYVSEKTEPVAITKFGTPTHMIVPYSLYQDVTMKGNVTSEANNESPKYECLTF